MSTHAHPHPHAPAADAPQAGDKAALLEFYRQMLAIRRMEEASAKAYAQQKIGGFQAPK